MQLRLLTRDDVRASITMREAIDANADAFVRLSSGEARVPLRVHQEAEGGAVLLMSARIPAAGSVGVKIVSAFPDNARRGVPMVHALVLVLDAATGEPRALMEGGWLTALRTGAASGVATDQLARPDAAVLALFGAGVQARTQLEAVRAVRTLREVRIVARTAESARRLADEAEADGLAARVETDPAAALRGADLVVAATTSRRPVFPGRRVEPGAHVNAVGSYTPAMREVDADLVARARVVVDSRAGALAEAGDLLHPLREGLLREADVAELGEVLAGTRPGRASPDEVTLFKSVGNAVQDAAVAARVLAAAERRGLGREVEM